MGQLFKILTSSAWLLLSAVLVVQSANAQSGKNYPPADEEWNAADYRALAEWVEAKKLELPTLSSTETKPIFERMVNVDNIPLRMGMNKELSITLRFQRLTPILKPLNRLIILYSNEAQKGKPYATEIARLKVYQSKASSALLEISEPYLSSLSDDKRYKIHVASLNEMKSDARKNYSALVQSMSEINLYSKTDILEMINGALNALPSYLQILTDQHTQDLAKTVTQQISKTSDQELKTALTELRDAIKHRRIRT